MVTAVLLGCASKSEELCPAGETRACPCPASCDYSGCGLCVALAIDNTLSGAQACAADGTWDECDCGPLEPECAGVDCASMCSTLLRAALDELPAGGSELDCRAAFVEVQKCVGSFCDGTAMVDGTCSAQVSVLDQACTGRAPSAPLPREASGAGRQGSYYLPGRTLPGTLGLTPSSSES